MDVLIKRDETTKYPNVGLYRTIEVCANGLGVLLILKPNGLQVVVQNASNRAWRGLGREFRDLRHAMTTYRDQRVLAALGAVAAPDAPGARERRPTP